MSMTMVIVPPVGPPTVVPIGRAVFPQLFDVNTMLQYTLDDNDDVDKSNNASVEYSRKPKIYLDDLFDVPQDSFYLDINKGTQNERRVFANGTIIIR